MSDSVRPHRRQPTRLLCAWDSPGKNTGVGCHFLLQCMKVKRKSLSHVRLLATPWTIAYQAPPSMGFSRQKYWSGVPLPSPLQAYRRWQLLQCHCSLTHESFCFMSLCFYNKSPQTSGFKESTCNAGDLGSIPGLGRSPGERNGYPLQYSCLENPMDGGAW